MTYSILSHLWKRTKRMEIEKKTSLLLPPLPVNRKNSDEATFNIIEEDLIPPPSAPSAATAVNRKIHSATDPSFFDAASGSRSLKHDASSDVASEQDSGEKHSMQRRLVVPSRLSQHEFDSLIHRRACFDSGSALRAAVVDFISAFLLPMLEKSVSSCIDLFHDYVDGSTAFLAAVVVEFMCSIPFSYSTGSDGVVHSGTGVFGSSLSVMLLASFSFESLIQNKLINAYEKCGYLDDTRKMFDHMPRRNTFNWIMILGTLTKCNALDKAMNIFEPDHCFRTVMVSAFVQHDCFEEAPRFMIDMHLENFVLNICLAVVLVLVRGLQI